MSTIYTIAGFNDDTTNNGNVLSGIFTGTSTNAGQVSAANFSGSSVNDGVVVTSASFTDTTVNNGELSGIATFAVSSTNNGTIYDSVVFADTTVNAGQISGTATFRDNTQNTGVVAGPVIFTGNAVNNNTVAQAIFLGNSVNAGTVSVSALFADSAGNAGTGVIQGYTIFADNAVNSGTVNGDADFGPDTSNTLGTVTGNVGSYTQSNGYLPNGYYAGGVKTAPADYDIIVHLVGSFWYKYDESGNGSLATGNYYDGSSWFAFNNGIKTVVYNKPINSRRWTDSIYTYLSASSLDIGTVIYKTSAENLRGVLTDPRTRFDYLSTGIHPSISLGTGFRSVANGTMLIPYGQPNSKVEYYTSEVGAITGITTNLRVYYGSNYDFNIDANNNVYRIFDFGANQEVDVRAMNMPNLSGVQYLAYYISNVNGYKQAIRGYGILRGLHLYGVDCVDIAHESIDGAVFYTATGTDLLSNIIYNPPWQQAAGYFNDLNYDLTSLSLIPASTTYLQNAVVSGSVGAPIYVSNSEGRFIRTNAASIYGPLNYDQPNQSYNVVGYISNPNSSPLSSLQEIQGRTIYKNGTLTEVLSNRFFVYGVNGISVATNNQGVASVLTNTNYNIISGIDAPTTQFVFTTSNTWLTGSGKTTAYSIPSFAPENINYGNYYLRSGQTILNGRTYTHGVQVSGGEVCVTYQGIVWQYGIATDHITPVNSIVDYLNYGPVVDHIPSGNTYPNLIAFNEPYQEVIITDENAMIIFAGYGFTDNGVTIFGAVTSASALAGNLWQTYSNGQFTPYNGSFIINGLGYYFINGYTTGIPARPWVGYFNETDKVGSASTLFTPTSATTLTVGTRLFTDPSLTQGGGGNGVWYLAVDGDYNDIQFFTIGYWDGANNGTITSIGLNTY